MTDELPRLADMDIPELAKLAGLTEDEILERLWTLDESARRLIQSRTPAGEALIWRTLAKGREQ